MDYENLTDIEILKYIKETIKKDISILDKFKIYSNNYISLKELDENFDETTSVFKNVEDNINTGIYYFYKNRDEYIKNESNPQNNEEEKRYEYLYDLRCKINNEIDQAEEKDEKLKEKHSKLKYFYNLVDKIGKIKTYVDSLRNKGSQINLLIEIHFSYNKDKKKGIFYLGDTEYDIKNEKSFDKIIKYLQDISDYYDKLISKEYKEDEYIRFVYGKQLFYIIEYLKGNNNDNSFEYYFLNKEPNDSFNKKVFIKNTDNSVKDYDIFFKNVLQSISTYIQSYFNHYYDSLEKFYNSYKVINNEKGFYYNDSEDCSIEERILDFFLEYINEYPISQNVLLINHDTSNEEIESFLYRSILCEYHTLFTIGINNLDSSQEDFILKKNKELINYIKKRDNPKDKNYSKIIPNIKSCIVFIYKKECSLIDKIKIYSKKLKRRINKDESQNNNIIQKNNRRDSSMTNFMLDDHEIERIRTEKKIEKVWIYTSDINGTGKSFSIKEDIDKKYQGYYVYFPFGGYLTKKIVYEKIKSLLEQIKQSNSKNICIHLDLYETEQKNIMNDFLFSFLFTKYYKNDENVIYINREFKIFIEIPNCFINFIDTYPMLKIFKNEQKIEINLNKLRPFKFKDYENDYIDSIKNQDKRNGKDLYPLFNEEKKIDAFIKENIGIDEPSYYQKRQFINSFLSQLKIKNIRYIDESDFNAIIKSTKYFTINPYSKLLKRKKLKNEEEILNELTNINIDDDDEYNKLEKDKVPLLFYHHNHDNIIPLSNQKPEMFSYVKMDKKEYEGWSQKQYLKEFKKIFNLKNPIDEEEKKITNSELKSLEEIMGKNEKRGENEYIITFDNFKKMILIYYKILSQLNLIIMGETGCGKTFLLKKLHELLNNGEEIEYILNIHGGYTDEKIIEEIEKINEETEKERDINKKHWVFFDEINTCKSMFLLSEIICNHSYNGKKLNKNLIFIGACNPYRKSKSERKENALPIKGKKQSKIIYNVYPLPQSLMNFVYYFGSIKPEDEKKYINAMIENIFNVNDEHDKKLKENTEELLYESHEFVRNNGDVSSVSLREIERFKKCYYFFEKYFKIKNKIKDEGINNEDYDTIIIKKKSIILSIYTCYYMRLSDGDLRDQLNTNLKGNKYFKEMIESEKDEKKRKKHKRMDY